MFSPRFTQECQILNSMPQGPTENLPFLEIWKGENNDLDVTQAFAMYV